MAITWATLRDDLNDWIVSITSSTVIWGRQTDAQPPPQYITLNIISGPVKLGSEDELRFNSSNDKFSTAGLRQFTLSIQSYGATAIQDMSDIMGSLDDPNVFEDLRSKGMSIVNTPSILDLSQILETVYEGRASMDLIMTTPDNRELALTYISTVNIDGDIDDGRVTMNFDVDLPP
jgi:hypothetical protein